MAVLLRATRRRGAATWSRAILRASSSWGQGQSGGQSCGGWERSHTAMGAAACTTLGVFSAVAFATTTTSATSAATPAASPDTCIGASPADADARGAVATAAASAAAGAGVSGGGARSGDDVSGCPEYTDRSRHSEESRRVERLLLALQTHFVRTLEGIAEPMAVLMEDGKAEEAEEAEKAEGRTGFEIVRWKRDGGLHGGGSRWQVEGSGIFNRASVNVSGVHYEEREKYPIDSATG